MGLTVGVNGQINPEGAGGVETNLVSMLDALAPYSKDMAFKVICLPQYVQAVERRAPFATPVPWTLGQSVDATRPAPPPARPEVARGKWIADLLGSRAGLFYDAVNAYRRLRYGVKTVEPDAEAIDAALAGAGIDIVHFTTPQYFNTRRPSLYEPWDLQHLHWPDFFDPAELDRRTRGYKIGCERATLVVTATEWIKRDIVDRLGIPASKVAVVPRSSQIGRRDLADAEVDALLASAKVPSDFLFYPAMCFPHKNHPRLIRALAICRNEFGLPLHLVLSGRIHKPYWPEVKSAIDAAGLDAHVTVLGAVSDDLLTALYKRTRFVVFPSLFEGLGLPLLEAMHLRVPVIAANSTCIPEVVGRAAKLFDGLDERAIAESIREAYTRPEEMRRLAEHGPEAFDVFSWSRGAPILVACYKHVAGASMSDEEKRLVREATRA